MKSKSLSKNLATVSLIVFTGYLNIASGAETPKAGGVAKAAEGSNSVADALQASDERKRGDAASAQAISTAQSALDKHNAECTAAEKELRELKSSVIKYCKAEFQKKLNEKDTDNNDKSKTRLDGAKQCSEEFDECLTMGEEENGFSSFMAGMTGAEAMPSWPAGDETSKKCSKYTADKLESAIEKATTALDTKKKELRDMTDKTTKSQEEMQEKYDNLQKKFLEAQEEKAKATRDSEESKLDKQAAFDKQKAEYESMIRKTEMELFQLQQQQSLMLKQRGREINGYKIAVLKCKEEVRKMRASSQSQVASNLSVAQQSDAKIVWAACVSNALQDRENEAAKYNVAMDTMEMNLQFKFKELEAIKQSSNRLAAMFNTSNEKQLTYEQEQEQKFLQKQQQSWLQMSKMVQDIQNKGMQNQKFLQDAETAVNTASNKLKNFESQEARGSKTLEEIGGKLSNYSSLEDTVRIACDKAKKKKLEDRLNKFYEGTN